MQDDEFEWDDDKAASNFGKHGVTFETARLAFQDPNWIDVEDANPDEERYNRTCMHDARVYVVVYVE